MEVTAFDRIKDVLFSKSEELEQAYKQNPEQIEKLYDLLLEGNIEGVDEGLNTWYGVSVQQRKAIYYSFLDDPKLKKGREELSKIILFLSAKENLLEKKLPFQEEYEAKNFKDLDFTKQDPDAVLIKFVQKITKFFKNFNIKDKTILQILEEEMVFKTMKKRKAQAEIAEKNLKRNNPATKAEQKKLEEDLKKYKDPFEKSIQNALISAFKIKHEITSSLEDLKKNVETLISDFEKNKDQFSRHPNIDIFNGLLEKIQKEPSYEKLLNFKKQFGILDLFQLERLVKKTDESKKRLEKKDAILIFGKTGSGKTSVVLRFLGESFKQIKLNGSVQYVVDEEKLDSRHSSFHTSFRLVSCTSCINSAEIPGQMLRRIRNNKYGNSIVIVDTPGFEDTRNCQFDIANQIGIRRALLRCNSIRMIILLPIQATQATCGRGEIVRKLARSMNELCYDLNGISALRVLVNQTQNISKEKFIGNIKELIQDHEENSGSTGDKEFFEKIQEDCQKPNTFIKAVSDEKEKYQLLLKSIFQLEPINRKEIKKTFRQPAFSTDSKNTMNVFENYISQTLKILFRKKQFAQAFCYYEKLKTFVGLFPVPDNEEQKKEEEQKKNLNESTQYENFTKELEYIHDFILQETIRYLEDLERNLKTIVDSDSDRNDEYYQEAKKNIQEIEEVNIYFLGLKGLQGLKGKKNIQCYLKDYGNRIKNQFVSPKELFQVEKLAKKLIKYSKSFKVEELVKNEIEERQKELSILVNKINKELKNEQFDLQVEDMQNAIRISKILDILKQDQKNACTKSVANLKRRGDILIDRYLKNISQVLDDNVLGRDIIQSKKQIENCDNLLRLNLLTSSVEKEAELKGRINQITRKCSKKIREINRELSYTSSEQIFQQKIINKIIETDKIIKLLMEFEFVKKSCQIEYEDMVLSIQQKFSDSKKDFEERNCFDRQQIQQYEEYFDKVKKNLANLMKYSKIIGKDVVVMQEIKSFINNIDKAYLQELNQVNNLRITWHHIQLNSKNIHIRLRKMKSLKKIIFPYEEFDPIQNRFSEITQAFDEKLAQPIENFKKEMVQKLPFGFSNFINFIKYLEKTLLYHKFLEESVPSFINRSRQKQAWQDLLHFIDESVISKIRSQIRKITQNDEIVVDKMMLTSTLILHCLQQQQHISCQLSIWKDFNPEHLLNDVRSKLQKQASKIAKCLKNEERIGILENYRMKVEDLMEINKNISQSDSLKCHEKRDDSYEKLFGEIVNKIKSISKNTKEKILNIFKNNFDMLTIFGQIEEVIFDIKKENNMEQDDFYQFLLKQLSEQAEKIKKDVREYERNNSQANLSFIDEIQTEPLLKYVKNCKDMLIYQKQIKNIQIPGNIPLKKYCQKFTPAFMENIEEKILEIFRTEKNLILKYCERFDFNKLNKRYQLIVEIEHCFKYAKIGQTEKQQFVKSILKILAKEIQKSLILEQKEIRSYSIQSVLKKFYSQYENKINSNYQGNKFNIDDRFSSVYEVSSKEKQKEFDGKVNEFLQNKISSYINSNGDFQDENSCQIARTIEKLPYHLRVDKKKEFQILKIKYQDEQEQKIDKMMKKIQQNPSGLYELAKIEKIYRGNIKKMPVYCEKFQICLKTIVNSSNNCEDKLKLFQNYFVNPSQQRIFQDKSKFQNIFQTELQLLLYSIEKELQQRYSRFFKAKLNQDQNTLVSCLDEISTILECLSVNYESQCFKTLKPKILENFVKEMNNLAFSFKKEFEEVPFETVLRLENSKLKKYLHKMHQNNIVIQLLVSKLSNEKQLKPMILNLEKIPEYEKIKDNIDDKIGEWQKKLLKFQFNTPQRHAQTLENMSEEFKEIGEMKAQLLNKLENYHVLLKEEVPSIQKKTDDFKDLFKGKYTSLVDEVERQVQNSFKDYQNNPTKLVNTFLIITKSLRQSNFLLIDSSTVSTSVKTIQQNINTNFQNLRSNTKKILSSLCQQYNRVNNKNVNKQKKGKTSIQKLKQEQKKELEKIKDDCRKQLEEQLKNQKKQEERKKKQDHFKTMQAGKIRTCKEKYKVKIQQIEQSVKSQNGEKMNSVSKNFTQLSELLILQQKNLLEINCFDVLNKSHFESMMKSLLEYDEQFIDNLSKSLMKVQDNYSYGMKILRKYKAFEGFIDLQRRELTKKQDIDYVIRETKILNSEMQEQDLKNTQKEQIATCYQNFCRQFETQVKYFEKEPSMSTEMALRSSILQHGRELKERIYFAKYSQTGRNKQLLIAKLFALHAILRASSASSSKESKGKRITIKFRPHEIQVVSVFLLLGIVRDENQSLENRMAEIGTGEGKSIVLAIVSAYLAVVGFNVRCVCYSQYLSDRDEDDFKKLFDFLDILGQIKYGTFNKVCEEILNPGKIDLKQKIREMILKKATSFSLFNFFARKLGLITSKKDKNEVCQNKTVLLIDEADVFFENNFYGQSYRPAIKLQSESISNFLQLVWRKTRNLLGEREMKVVYDTLKKSKEFEQVLKEYENLADIIENQLHSMIQGAFDFKHQYFLNSDKKLVYKDCDSMNQRISYGYKTVFANIYEYERGNVSKGNLEKALAIELVVAEFSYAELPNFFTHIIGVTGTYKAMPQVKKQVLHSEYEIIDNYLIPSSFGLNQKKKCHYLQVEQKQLHQAIVDKIKKIDPKRPIIIFFKTTLELNDFFHSAPFSDNLKSRTSVLTEEHDPSYREKNIHMATQPSNIALMTKAYGRGTDFQVLDKNIQEKGGVHIIQTFLSEEEAEEVQIKGRTNRQNSPGSVDIIFSRNQLELLKITEDLSKLSQEKIIQILSEARKKKANSEFDGVATQAKESKKRHNQVWKIFSSQKIEQKQLIRYIESINCARVIGDVRIRTVVAIDGTCSMSLTLKRVIEVVSETFKKTYAVLEEQKQEVLVQMAILVYRNYNSDFTLLSQSTPFQSDHQKLNKFLSSVSVSGGWGNEAIEVCFQAINKMENVSQVVLIGDAPGNTDAEVIEKRALRGEEYWNKYDFPMTTQAKELQQLRAKRIPIHTFSFYFSQGQFRAISKHTEGEAHAFPNGTQAATNLLSNVLGVNIMKIGERKLKEMKINNPGLVDEFVKRYC